MSIDVLKLRNINYKLDGKLFTVEADKIIFNKYTEPEGDWLFFQGNFYEYWKWEDSKKFYKLVHLVEFVEE